MQGIDMLFIVKYTFCLRRRFAFMTVKELSDVHKILHLPNCKDYTYHANKTDSIVRICTAYLFFCTLEKFFKPNLHWLLQTLA